MYISVFIASPWLSSSLSMMELLFPKICFDLGSCLDTKHQFFPTHPGKKIVGCCVFGKHKDWGKIGKPMCKSEPRRFGLNSATHLQEEIPNNSKCL